jgi:hypothetical protein
MPLLRALSRIVDDTARGFFERVVIAGSIGPRLEGFEQDQRRKFGDARKAWRTDSGIAPSPSRACSVLNAGYRQSLARAKGRV